MIQPHELRIGNMVNTIYGITTIIGVVDNGLEDYAMFIRTDSGHLHRTDGTKSTPIPLTEEWLIKAGFVKLNYKSYGHIVTVYELNGIRIGLSGDDFYLCTEMLDRDDCLYWETLGIPIATVHHWQNVFHALTGEELNVKLS